MLVKSALSSSGYFGSEKSSGGSKYCSLACSILNKYTCRKVEKVNSNLEVAIPASARSGEITEA